LTHRPEFYDGELGKERAVTEPTFTIEEVSDPVENARFMAQHEQYKRNSDWLHAHWSELLPQALGEFVAVAGQEPFLADASEEDRRLAKAAHPEDTGLLCQYVIPRQGPRFHANFG
jgi:hypothetical protein